MFLLSIIAVLSFSDISYTQTAERGKAVFDTIAKKYLEVKPIAWGLATSTPKVLVVIPEVEWNKISKDDQISLTLYVESLIPVVRSAPDNYITIPQTAPIYEKFRDKATKLCDDCWAIAVGRLQPNKLGAFVDKVVVQGDIAWAKDDECCRGVSASEFRSKD